uniref:Uncharacterized protein n=1 Tax=Quercus lobata TaxID=97700 RepID=A0A7N2LJC2_QUELO
MKQTVLIQVSMDGQRNFFRITEGEKARKKAMKIAVSLSVVESLGLKGKQRDQIEVKGDNIDTVKLATLLRKKVGHASILAITTLQLTYRWRRFSSPATLHPSVVGDASSMMLHPLSNQRRFILCLISDASSFVRSVMLHPLQLAMLPVTL